MQEELIKPPWPLGGITYSISDEVVGVKLNKENIVRPKLKKKYFGMNNRLPSQDSSTIWT